MSSNITQIQKEYEEKLKEIKALMKNPSSDSAIFSNNTDFLGINIYILVMLVVVQQVKIP
ncbi:hypothetical protein [Borrelia miyamotoi]|uniref:hypothetical protein n=1 Tax=Borrelia miyamotoi TaxID=47466 RepID=UPI002FBDA77B